MPDPVNIEQALRESILTTRRAPSTEPRATFWASSLGMCPRKLILERAGVQPLAPLEDRSVFKMWAGTVLGHEIQKLLETQGFLDPTWTEKRLTYRSVSGKCDGLTHQINGDCIVEIKTADDRAVTKPDFPEHYLWQGFWYCMASGVDAVCFLMVGKNQGLTKHRVLHITDQWRKDIDEEITQLEESWARYEATGEIPPCRHRFGWEDTYCPYGDTGGSNGVSG